MTHLQLINRFWDADRATPFTPCETRLYLMLLDTASRKGWPQNITLSMDEAAQLVGVTVPTFLKARSHLVERGFISCGQGGGRRRKASYRITDAPAKSTKNSKTILGKDGINPKKNDTVFTVNSKENTPLYFRVYEQNPKTVLPFTPIDIDSSYRESNINIPLSHKRECEREGTKEFFVECRDYFLSPERREFQEAQERLYGISDLAGAFRDFYDILVSEDLLKEVRTRRDFARLFKYKHCLPNQHKNETKRKDRLSERRGTDPSALSAEDYTDTL